MCVCVAAAVWEVRGPGASLTLPPNSSCWRIIGVCCLLPSSLVKGSGCVASLHMSKGASWCRGWWGRLDKRRAPSGYLASAAQGLVGLAPGRPVHGTSVCLSQVCGWHAQEPRSLRAARPPLAASRSSARRGRAHFMN